MQNDLLGEQLDITVVFEAAVKRLGISGMAR